MDGATQHFDVVRLRHRTRLLQDDAVLSEILHARGPTHRFTDLLAACVATLAPGPRVLILGFAGGGVVAPLRALGWEHALRAVDLSAAGEELFREHSNAWAGHVTLEIAEAGAYLRSTRRRFDLILEDLSVPGPEGVTKPRLSIEELPSLMRSRLLPTGVVVTNMLPMVDEPRAHAVALATQPWRRVIELSSEEYWNRTLVAGHRLPGARSLSSRLRRSLARIRSRMATGFQVRTLR